MFSHRIGVSIALIGLSTVALILFFGHPGFALRVTNYLFFVILFLVTWGYLRSEK